MLSSPVVAPSRQQALSDQEKRRQLIRPSKHIPWGVQVVSLIPENVSEVLMDVVSAAVVDGWCALVLPRGRIHTYPVRTYTLSQELKPAKLGHVLYNPVLANTTPIMALASCDYKSSGGAQQQQPHQRQHAQKFVHVYAAHPQNGSVCVWRVGQQETPTLLQRKYQAKVRIGLEDEEEITCLSGAPLVVGTSLGRVFWCTQTARPLALHAQPLDRPVKSGLYNRLLSLATTSTADEQSGIGSPIHDILDMKTLNSSAGGGSSSLFLSVTESGIIEHWHVTTTIAASHKANFKVSFVTNLKEALEESWQQQQQNGMDGQPTLSVHELQVVQSTTMKQETSTYGLNFIVRVTTSSHESRLYWLQAVLEYNDDLEEDSGVDQMKFTLNSAIWLSRFYNTTNISCVGLTTTHECITYAAFQDTSDISIPVTVMALLDDSTVIHEVDLPSTQAPRLVEGTLGKDIVTHGWCALASSSLGIRGRWTGLQMDATSATPAKKSKRGNAVSVVSLTSHLRSAFWHWYQHPSNQQHGGRGQNSDDNTNNTNTTFRLPPSLENASVQDLELAILSTATQLQHEGTDLSSATSSSQNPMEWHISLVQLLQQGGLYRSLLGEGRYALLGIGQELAVHQCLAQQRQTDLGLAHELENLQPHGVAEWLLKIQSRVLQDMNDGDEEDVTMQGTSGSSSSKDLSLWCNWLALTLQTATTYRHDRSSVLYDIVSESHDDDGEEDNDSFLSTSLTSSSSSSFTSRLWTCHPNLQQVLIQQLEFWNTVPSEMVDGYILKVVVEAALSSFADSRLEGNNTDDNKNNNRGGSGGEEKYNLVKELAFPLLRRILMDGDAVAFQLGVQYHYYDGLCDISYQYDKHTLSTKEDNPYKLDQLLISQENSRWQQVCDYKTGLSFPEFVLQWHINRGLHAQVLDYGRYCPALLSTLLAKDERLQKFQWIPSIRSNKYEDASLHLLANTQSPDSSSTLSSTRRALSLAKLSNRLASDSGTANAVLAKRQKTIENKLELVQAQELLMESSHVISTNKPLMSAERLLSLTFDQLERVNKENDGGSAIEESVRFCLIGLAICRSMEDKDKTEIAAAASRVWAKSLMIDLSSTWGELIRSQQSMATEVLKKTILESTVFGRLVEEYHENTTKGTHAMGEEDPASFQYLKEHVLERLGLDHTTRAEMKRLLQIANADYQEGQQ